MAGCSRAREEKKGFFPSEIGCEIGERTRKKIRFAAAAAAAAEEKRNRAGSRKVEVECLAAKEEVSREMPGGRKTLRKR